MVFIENITIVILFFVGMVIIGYCYYRKSIKVAKELIRIGVGNQQYERLRRY